jgi:hypothetical protein
MEEENPQQTDGGRSEEEFEEIQKSRPSTFLLKNLRKKPRQRAEIFNYH